MGEASTSFSFKRLTVIVALSIWSFVPPLSRPACQRRGGHEHCAVFSSVPVNRITWTTLDPQNKHLFFICPPHALLRSPTSWHHKSTYLQQPNVTAHGLYANEHGGIVAAPGGPRGKGLCTPSRYTCCTWANIWRFTRSKDQKPNLSFRSCQAADLPHEPATDGWDGCAPAILLCIGPFEVLWSAQGLAQQSRVSRAQPSSSLSVKMPNSVYPYDAPYRRIHDQPWMLLEVQQVSIWPVMSQSRLVVGEAYRRICHHHRMTLSNMQGPCIAFPGAYFSDVCLLETAAARREGA
ncbi:hypothetical protein GGR56DRAFT_423615 [Xylariaceae sp. FL0804]|nr:hypothetical protein GGR56DRAFT_423615 [Xylariaceae sp. FL0804]